MKCSDECLIEHENQENPRYKELSSATKRRKPIQDMESEH